MWSIFLASVSAEPLGMVERLQKYLPFQGLGLLVVLITLITLSAVCSLVGILFQRAGARKPAVPAPVGAPPASLTNQSVADAEATDPRVIAAIAAAIAVTLDRPYRIIEIEATGHAVGMSSAWAIEGRFQHFSSHKVR